MKIIYLDRDRPVAVEDEAYERILKIVEENKICKGCFHPYTAENPNIAQNLCVECLLKRQAHRQLRFVGETTTGRRGYKAYKLMSPEGYIYLSWPSSEDLLLSISETVQHWRFPLPEYYVNSQGEQEYLGQWHITIYGDFTRNAAIVIELTQPYGTHKSLAFLSYRDGECRLINRRTRQFRRWFAEARKRAEATRNAYGFYSINGYTTSYLYSSDLYPLVADIASEEHGEQLAVSQNAD